MNSELTCSNYVADDTDRFTVRSDWDELRPTLDHTHGGAASTALRRDQTDRDLALALQVQVEEERKYRKASKAVQRRTRDCVVCGDELPTLSFPVKGPTASCAHEVKTCQGCLEQWVASELSSKGWDRIRCPECPELLQHPDVHRAAAKDVFEKYDRLATQSLLAADPNFHWCLNPKCKSGQIQADNPSYPSLLACGSCRYRQCTKHQRKWHEGETCVQYDYRASGQKQRDEEAASEKRTAKTTKKCPGKNCGWNIEKKSGCDHMTCRKCRHQFCWLCLASYKEIKRVGNTAHTAACAYHSDSLRYPH
ncbi:hypothetical protein BJ546DRAFT_690698 [Cryomyces antarcticus]